ncbi:hypothetical protein PM082_003571 [Marasmius tenuissimus]|nr:hypothetical protein PM082_003571 [Marasmius tenuissimus]
MIQHDALWLDIASRLDTSRRVFVCLSVPCASPWPWSFLYTAMGQSQASLWANMLGDAEATPMGTVWRPWHRGSENKEDSSPPWRYVAYMCRVAPLYWWSPGNRSLETAKA